jgi:class 3 adenylate cyclase
MDKAEAEAPIRELARKVVIASCAGALLVSLLALLSAQVLTRPLRVLTDGARRLDAGETGVRVNVPSRDEFGQLAGVFNDMSANIKTQTERLESQRQENHELLLNLLPATAVAQRQAGDGAAQSQFNDVSVLCATVVNLDTLAAGLDDSAALARLSELVSAFDEAAERCGVERIEAHGGAYLAACGLSVNLPDHARRTVNFALEMTRIVTRFNREQHVGLALAIGINTGPLAGGVIGRRKFRYALWGETVNVALALANQHPEGIRVTAAVRERLGDENAFTAAGQLKLASKPTLEFWQLSA